MTTNTPKFEWFEWSDISDSSGVTYDFVIVGTLDGQAWLHFLTKMNLTSPYYTLTSDEALSDGEYSWRVRAIDGANNESAWSVAWSLNVKTAVVPPTPPGGLGAPVSEVDEVEAYWRGSPLTITASALDSDGGSVESVELWYRWSYDNSTWIPWTPGGRDISSPWEWSFNAPAGDGFYEFYSIATDNAGNVEAARDVADASCGVDTIAPPTPELSIPSRASGDNTPSLDWSDENDPRGVTYEFVIEIDGRSVLTKTGLTVSAYTLEADEALSVGAYNWRVRAVDGVGNASDWSTTLTFVVVPTVAIGGIPAGGTRLADFGRYNVFAIKVAITALRDISDAEVSIEEFIGRPAWLSEPPETAYPGFATIVTNIEPSDISSVAVQFQLSRAWVEQNEIDENTVEIFKFDSEWRALPTTLIGEDENHIYFEAVTSGFSVFAAAGGKRTPSPGIIVHPPSPLLFYALLSFGVTLGGSVLAYRLYRLKRKSPKPRPIRKPYLMLKRIEEAVVKPRKGRARKHAIEPKITSFVINSGAKTTSSRKVALSTAVSKGISDLAQMRFSNDKRTWSAWKPFSKSKAHTLSAGDGPKTIYVRVKDRVGLISPVASASIELRTHVGYSLDELHRIEAKLRRY